MWKQKERRKNCRCNHNLRNDQSIKNATIVMNLIIFCKLIRLWRTVNQFVDYMNCNLSHWENFSYMWTLNCGKRASWVIYKKGNIRRLCRDFFFRNYFNYFSNHENHHNENHKNVRISWCGTWFSNNPFQIIRYGLSS